MKLEERYFGKSRSPLWWVLLGAVIFFLLLFVLIRFLPFSIARVTGTERTEADQVIEKLFPEEERTMLNLGRKLLKGQTVPGIRSWKVLSEGLTSYRLIIREEEAVAMIRSEGRYLVLSGDGAVLSVSNSPADDLMMITGCGLSGGEPLTYPEVQDQDAFQGLLIYAREVNKVGLDASMLQYSDGLLHLRLNNIDISLGGIENAESKIRVVNDQKDLYEGLNGTLHLENYDPGNANERYVFEVSTESAN